MIANPDDPTETPEAVQSAPSTTVNPVVEEIDRAHESLSPQAKEALERAHGILGIQPPGAGPSAPPAATTSQLGSTPASDGIAAPPTGIPGMIGVTNSDLTANQPAEQIPKIRGIESPALAPQMGKPPSANQERLASLQQSGSGISQIHNPWARVPLQILDAVGSGLFPRIASGIPGTEAHHELLTHQAGTAVAQDQAAEKAQEEADTAVAEQGRLQALARDLDSRPEIKEAQNDLKAKDLELRRQHEEDERQRKSELAEQTLHQHGFKRDEKGNIIPLPYEEMTGPQRDIHDYKTSQEELNDARAELVKAQENHLPVAEKLAQLRIQNATASHKVAAERLGLSEKQTEARLHGTENGAALPGAMIADDGRPVGTAFQGNVRPTGTQRNKGNLAESAAEQVADLQGIIAKRPDIFGPVAGRVTDFKVWLGSQDPDAQRFRAARTIAADHLAGVFGGRSEAALDALDSAIGRFKDNPEAVKAGLNQVLKGNSVFQKAGTVKTVGSAAEHKGASTAVDPNVKAYADAYFSGDTAKAQAAIDSQRKK